MGRGRRLASGLEAFWDLERFLARASRTHLRLPEIERESESRGRELIRLALQAHLDGRGDGDVGPAVVVSGPGGPVRLAYKKLHTRRILTLFGEVTLTRVGYGAPGQSSIHPLDAELGLPARSYSYEICRRLVRSAVCGPFDEATSLVAEMTGLVVPKRSAERIVLEAAVDFEDSSSTRGGSQAQLSPKEIVVGAIDCKGIPMVKPEGAATVVRRPKGEKANKKGWPIASGSVEGACKNLIRDRFERSGMRWSPVMAEAMLKLRAVYLCGDFDSYWEWHIRQDQQRLYPKALWRVARK